MFDIVRTERPLQSRVLFIGYLMRRQTPNSTIFLVFPTLRSIVPPAPSLLNYRTWTKHLRLESPIYFFYYFFILFLLSTNYYYN